MEDYHVSCTSLLLSCQYLVVTVQEETLFMQNKLYIWENSREKERRRLLVEEAEDKQRDGVWIDEKRGFLDKLVTR